MGEQCMGGGFILGLEVAEEADLVVVEVVVQLVPAGADATDTFRAAIRRDTPRYAANCACSKNGFLLGSSCYASALVIGGT